MSKKTATADKPQAYLAINKSRIKMYGKKKSIPSYYLEKGQEFQIELYNPTQEKVLTTFKFNNKAISGGLILRPGERVFLDRYLDASKKFLFDTYKVENSKSSRKAIEPNGDVEIAFFKEVNQVLVNTLTGTLNIQYDPVTYAPINHDITLTPDVQCFSGQQLDGNTQLNENVTLTTNSGPVTSDSLTLESDSNTTNVAGTPTRSFLTSGKVGNIGLSHMSVSARQGYASKSLKSRKTKAPDKIETGRVEQGSKSNQDLCEGTGDFEMMSFHVIRYKLLPKSQKKLSTKEYYTKYCGNCGAKCKTPFCPHCGAKQ